MLDVDFLFVISSRRGAYAMMDLVASLRWSCTTHTFYAVCVDETGLSTPVVDAQFSVVNAQVSDTSAGLSGFQRGAVLARSRPFNYSHAVLLSDTGLVLQPGFDQWLMGVCQTPNVGLIGVEDSGWHEPMFTNSLPLLTEWGVPHQAWEMAPPVLADEILVLPPLALKAQPRVQFCPAGWEKWPGTYGAYLAWQTVMRGLNVVSWGYTNKSLPPLFVPQSRGQFVPPHFLAPMISFHGALDRVLSYSESDLREMFKRMRGETYREIKPFGPGVIAGPIEVVT